MFQKFICEEVPFLIKLRSFSTKFSRAYCNSCFFLILLQHKQGFALVGECMIGVPPTPWIFSSPLPQSRCNPNGVPSPPKNESPTENEPPIHWNMKSPLKKWFLEKKSKSCKLPLITLFYFWNNIWKKLDNL